MSRLISLRMYAARPSSMESSHSMMSRSVEALSEMFNCLTDRLRYEADARRCASLCTYIASPSL